MAVSCLQIRTVHFDSLPGERLPLSRLVDQVSFVRDMPNKGTLRTAQRAAAIWSVEFLILSQIY